MCEIRGIGIDLCAIDRMEGLLSSGHSLRRILTPEEEAYVRSRGAGAAQSLAGLFAAKEAVLKALGTGLTIPMTDIVITHTDLGQPLVTLTGKAAELGAKVMVSITHEGGMAAAVGIWN